MRMLKAVPKLWTETVETHRQEVREAILDATGKLVLSRGLLSVTMSQIADATGIGRATLYKYFPDVEQVLAAWHQRHVAGHLAELAEIRDRLGEPAARLRAMLETYARICRQRRDHGDTELAAVLHRGEPIPGLQRELHNLVAGLVGEAAAAGVVRRDVPASELADYSIHALDAAGVTRSLAALTRLVNLVWSGLTVPAESGSSGE
jgi:AcrR family transcriptional regulator